MPQAPVIASADPPTSEWELVRRAQGGSREAFNELVAAHEQKLLRFLLQRTRCPADAEDAMQEALVKACRHLARFDGRSRFATWLFAIANRELITIQRRSRRAGGTLAAAGAIAAPTDPPIDEPSSLWAAARRLLSDEQYAALWLHYGEDLPPRQIATVLGRSRVWVRVSLLRARRALRQVVQRDGQLIADPTLLNACPDGGQP